MRRWTGSGRVGRDRMRRVWRKVERSTRLQAKQYMFTVFLSMDGETTTESRTYVERAVDEIYGRSEPSESLRCLSSLL